MTEPRTRESRSSRASAAARAAARPPDVFRRVRTITGDDIDELGHVNNVVWVRFVVEMATSHSEALGLDAAAYRRLGAWWIVYRHEIDYRAPAFPGDRIVEETWVSEMRGARSVRQVRFRRESDGTPLLDATTTWVFVDADTHRPRRIAPEVRAAFEPAFE